MPSMAAGPVTFAADAGSSAISGLPPFAAALSMPKSFVSRRPAQTLLIDRGVCQGAQTPIPAGCGRRNRPARPALTFVMVEHIMRDESGRKVETSVEARAGFLD